MVIGNFTNKDFFPNCYLKPSNDSKTYEFNGIIASIEFYLIHIKILLVFIFSVKSKTYIEVIILNKPSFKDNNFTKNNIGIKGLELFQLKTQLTTTNYY